MADTNLGRVTFNLRGTWSGSVLDYKRLDVVNYTIGGRSISFASKIDNPTETPSLGSAEWMEIGYEGLKGDQGDAFTFDDFTPEQITLLQQPAIDAADIADAATINANTAANNANEAAINIKSYVNYIFGITQPELALSINRAFDEGFKLPSQSRLLALDKLISKWKTADVFNIDDKILNFAYNEIGTEGFSRIDLRNPNGDLCLYFGGLQFSPTYGVRGNGVDAYINTVTNLRNSINYSLNSASRLIVVSYANPDITKTWLSSSSGYRDYFGCNQFNTQKINCGTGNLDVAPDLRGTGLKALVRKDSTTVEIYNKGIKQTAGSASTIVENSPDNLLSQTAGVNYDNGIFLYTRGGYIDETKMALKRTAYNEYLIEIGLTAIA